MRAIVVPKLGGPDVLTLREVLDPKPADDQVVVKLKYAGVSFGDVYQREGTYRAGKPLGPNEVLPIGGEGVGTISAVGGAVKDLAVGDTVIFAENLGSYAEYAAVPAWRAIKVPPGLSPRDAISAYSQGLTAHYLAHDSGKLRSGMSCLVHASAGGVGHILVQLAKKAGASVIATVGSKDKAAFVSSLGADKVVLYRETPFLQEVKTFGDGKGVHVAYDSIGKATIDDSIKSVRMHGLCVLYGNASGLVDAVAPMDLAAAGSIFFQRPRLAHHVKTREEISRRANDLFAGVVDGSLKAAVSKVFPLAEANEAHRLLETRTTMGKLLLEVS
jgi:NADPH2:quinone reductase